ncbi:uncharacterized protein [Mytilus edulis]|uniref:uncharacterized protein n=1 Tax=Mytilus edulis TaxID=6550 RepID=UPI0039F0975E
MDIIRLKSLRAGNKAAVTKVFKKLEEAIGDSEIDTEEVSTLLEAIEKKKKTLASIDEQILNAVESEDITNEILETDEYYLDLEGKIRKFKKFLKPVPKAASSILDSSAPEFVPYTNPFTHTSQPLSQSSSTSSNNHRLPKLSLPNFNGDILQWQYFWDSYETTIHHNHTLTDIQKFSYLNSLLQFEAANVISGLTMTNPNYHKAIELLRNRYGQPHKIINAYMRALLDIPAPHDTLESLRTFHDKSEAYIWGLESLGQCQDMYGSLLIPVILGKLPHEVRKNITRENGSDSWNIQSLRIAIGKKISIQESGYGDYTQTYSTATPSANFITGVKRVTTDKTRPINTTDKSFNSNRKKQCAYCDGNHWPNECKDVIDHDKRVAIIKEKRLCFNCLGKHKIADCKSKNTCKCCHRKHHSSLCKQNSYSNKHHIETEQSQNKVDTETSMLYTASEERSTVLLKTAFSPVVHKNTCIDARILFDEGAQRSFITEELAAKLNIKKEGSETLSIATFGSTTKKVRNLDKTTINLKSTEGELIPIKVLIVPTIASPLQTHNIGITQKFSYLRGLQLAHPVMDGEQFEISLLIGGDFYWDIVQDKIVRGNGPTAVSSKIGYLLSGPVPTRASNASFSMMNILVCHKQEECDLEKFWKLESLGIDAKEQNDPDLAESIENYLQTSITKKNDKYIAKLPWRENAPELPTNEDIAKRRTESVIRRLKKDPEMFRKYGEIITDQEQRGFIEKVCDESTCTNKVHYIPHHPVKKDSVTTPIRIVYNCSCRANDSSPCLNDCLATYPPIMTDLTEILVRFRMYKYAVTADIEKAFLHIELDVDDRDVARFYWLENPMDTESRLITYRFKVVLFGATCSPFMLSATLMKHFRDNPSTTSTELQRNLYVDNVLTSFTDKQSLLKFYTESRKLLSEAGFNLRSWNSNSTELQNVAGLDKIGDNDDIVKILGMRWDRESDDLKFQQIEFMEKDRMITKREVLRTSSRIFDPLGLITPITVKAKLFMQTLWKAKLDWDECLSDELRSKWQVIALDIEEATKIVFPRMLTEGVINEKTSLHIFTDASQLAYGACAYLVTANSSILVMAKNRVVPVKPISLPRLELMGALIGARLATHLLKVIPTEHVYMWSDSQIVLSWIQSSKILKPFVANRLKEIRKLTENAEWNYCPTDDNPADYLTRGIYAKQLYNNSLWMNGPQWILNRGNWPTWTRKIEECSTMITVSDEKTDDKSTNALTQTISCIDIQRYSSLEKAIRVTAYVMRFIQNIRNSKDKRSIGFISVEERCKALKVLIMTVQQETFKDEIESLNSSSQKKVPLVRQLKLYTDKNGLLRCTGKIQNAPVKESTKYPLLLPTHHSLTSLIVMDAHTKTLHAGLNSTIAYIQQKYWIPRIRQCVKSQIRKCVQCIKISGMPYSAPDPPPLPKDRVNYDYPFSVTGVVFTGALYTKGKHNELSKTYICLFTCAATRAIHLEIVTDLTEESFILAFKRFVARRSTPRIMLSDNATTFKAAAEKITRSNKDNRIQEKLADQGTEWKFIPNRAPWFGGFWERLIGLTKKSIKAILGKSCVSTEMLNTIVIEIEGTLNNRPITHISTDIKDPEPLTPAHLLYGRRLDNQSEQNIDSVTSEDLHVKLNKNLQRNNELINHFRSRWKHEYLTSLREFHRTSGRNEQTIQIGDIVQVHNDTNRIMWKLAVVQDLVRGKDGLIRSAVIKTDTGITNRPIVKLYPLEIRSTHDDSE